MVGVGEWAFVGIYIQCLALAVVVSFLLNWSEASSYLTVFMSVYRHPEYMTIPFLNQTFSLMEHRVVQLAKQPSGFTAVVWTITRGPLSDKVNINGYRALSCFLKHWRCDENAKDVDWSVFISIRNHCTHYPLSHWLRMYINSLRRPTLSEQ